MLTNKKLVLSFAKGLCLVFVPSFIILTLERGLRGGLDQLQQQQEVNNIIKNYYKVSIKLDTGIFLISLLSF